MQTVSNIFLTDALKGVAIKGYDLATVFRKADIPFSLYSNTAARINGVQMSLLLRQLLSETDDCFLCWGQSPVSHKKITPIVARIFAQCKTLRHLLEEWVECINLLQDVTRHSLEINSHHIIWRQQTSQITMAGARYLLPSLQRRFQLIWMSWYAGREIIPTHVAVPAEYPENRADIETLLPCDTSFGHADGFMVLDRKYLDYPLIRTSQNCLNRYNPSPVQDFFTLPVEKEYFTRCVERQLRDRIQDCGQLPGLPSVADKMAMSVRSLERRLKQEGSCFQDIKNDVRCRLAYEKIAGTDKSFAVIASELGYVEPASFWRAFRQWTGQSPQTCRDQIRATRQ